MCWHNIIHARSTPNYQKHTSCLRKGILLPSKIKTLKKEPFPGVNAARDGGATFGISGTMLANAVAVSAAMAKHMHAPTPTICASPIIRELSLITENRCDDSSGIFLESTVQRIVCLRSRRKKVFNVLSDWNSQHSCSEREHRSCIRGNHSTYLSVFSFMFGQQKQFLLSNNFELHTSINQQAFFALWFNAQSIAKTSSSPSCSFSSCGIKLNQRVELWVHVHTHTYG